MAAISPSRLMKQVTFLKAASCQTPVSKQWLGCRRKVLYKKIMCLTKISLLKRPVCWIIFSCSFPFFLAYKEGFKVSGRKKTRALNYELELKIAHTWKSLLKYLKIELVIGFCRCSWSILNLFIFSLPS